MRSGGPSFLSSTLFTLGCVLAASAPAAAEGEGDPPAAGADKATFEQVAAGATRVDRDGLAGLVWARTASCDGPGLGDDLARRQCRAIKAARGRAVDGGTFVVPADASAFPVGAWEAKKKALPLTLAGCVACVEPLELDGAALYVVSGAGAPAFAGAVARGPSLHDTSRPFASEDEAIRWRTEVVPRLRTELVVRFGAAGKDAWEASGKRGINVEVVGFRVWDPCDGGIVCASPRSGKAPVDKVACGGEAVVEGKPDADAPARPARDAVPAELDSAAIKRAMAPVRPAAEQCLARYGVPGDAKLRVTVAGDGAVVAVEQTGDFVDTPTGACIEQAVKAITFPKTKKTRQSFSYPVVLR